MTAAAQINVSTTTVAAFLRDWNGYTLPAAFLLSTAAQIHIDPNCGKTVDDGHSAASYLGYTVAHGKRTFRFTYTDTDDYNLDLLEDEIQKVIVTKNP